MTNGGISRISSAFSTGGGGTNFEQRVQALFLVSLLCDGYCPFLNEPINKICFQAKHLGYDVDDLVVITNRGQGEGRILCQIKHTLSVTQSDREFRAVIAAAWREYNKDSFDKNRDLIVLATAQIPFKYQKALRAIYTMATAAIDEVDFLDRIEKTYYSNKDNGETLDILKSCILGDNDNNELSDHALWGFCKVFLLVIFDLDYEKSINRTLATSLIKCHVSMEPAAVWAKLVEYAGYCNQKSAIVDIDCIEQELSVCLRTKNKQGILLPETIPEIDTFYVYVALVGSWREDNEYDRHIIEIISGVSYSECETKARGMLLQSPDYIELHNGCWKVLHNEELLQQCADQVYDDTISRLIVAAKEVFTQKSKSVMSENRYFVSSTGEYNNSQELRRRLLSNICWINESIPSLHMCTADRISTEISLFEKELLSDFEWKTWASLKGCMQELAELEPDIFLDKIEEFALKNPQEFIDLVRVG